MSFSPKRRPLHGLGALTLTLMLAACGSDDPAPTEVLATADTLSVGSAQSASVLANDRIGGAPASLGSAGNATLSWSGTPPTGVTLGDGLISVARGTAPGSYNLAYRLCERAAPDNCANGSVSLTVPNPPVVAVADTLSLGTGSSASLLGNDTVDGEAATAARVSAAAVGSWPSGISLSAAGLLRVDGGMAAGSQSLSYRICLLAAPTVCSESVGVALSITAQPQLSGRALNASTGQAAAGVTVRLGSNSVQTGADGSFSLPVAAADERALLRLNGGGFGESTRVIRLAASGQSDLQVRLLPVSQTGSVDAAAGGTVGNAAGTARVTLPAAGLQRADGTAATGAVAVRLTAIDPSLDSSLMPGDYSTVVAGAERQIESFGALAVELRDSADQALNLRAGQTATIRIPLGTRSPSPPASVPLFFFDEASGRWVQEGSATLQGSGSARYYEGTVAHFSVWNADRLIDTVFLQGCVADGSGQRVAGALVSSDGIDYSGSSVALSDANGNFRLPLRRSSSATLVALRGALFSNTLRADPSSTDFTRSDCLVLAASQTGISITLTWGQNPSDLDSHLYAPDGTEVFYGSKGSLASAPFANLDVDDTSSFGPEVITLTRLMVGTYRYAVNNYSGQASTLLSASQARVSLRLPNRAAELFLPPATGESRQTNYWTVFELDVDAQCRVTLRRVEAYSVTEPSTPRATVSYCSNT